MITTEKDEFFNPIDFRKALGLNPYDRFDGDIAYGCGCAIVEREDGLVDIGFCTRNYTHLPTIIEFITRYPDAEWWIQQDWVDVYHYYWYEGEVIEDIHKLTEDEGEYLGRLLDLYDSRGDEDEHYDMIFTEKMDQSDFVNFRPDFESNEYKDYQLLVEKIADRIVAENRIHALKKYDYNWEDPYRHYSFPMEIRMFYLYDMDLDSAKYKLNVMSEDVLDAVQKRLYPFDKKMHDAVFGLAIGDALGVPYEFHERGTFNCEGMEGYGSHNQPAGTWSDDTSMTLATLKSLKDNGGKVVVEDIRRNYLKWLNEQQFTASGEIFDIGHATQKALKTGEPRSGEYENGNGSLMRILPLAFTDCSDDEVRAVSAITHSHWISMEACVIYVNIARRLIAGESFDDIIPTLKYDKPFHRLCIIDKLKEDQIRSSGFVVDTLEAALWALAHRERVPGGWKMKGYEEDVLRAINLGEDTDTVGAVTGGLVGLRYGTGFFMWDEWYEKIKNKELIKECLW